MIFIVPGLVDDFDGFIPGLIVKAENVTAARLDGAVVVFSVGVGLRRTVLSVPEATHHERMIDQTMLEGHQDFVVHLGQEVRSPVLP